jgi:hypothetical protein
MASLNRTAIVIATHCKTALCKNGLNNITTDRTQVKPDNNSPLMSEPGVIHKCCTQQVLNSCLVQVACHVDHDSVTTASPRYETWEDHLHLLSWCTCCHVAIYTCCHVVHLHLLSCCPSTPAVMVSIYTCCHRFHLHLLSWCQAFNAQGRAPSSCITPAARAMLVAPPPVTLQPGPFVLLPHL